MIPEGKELLPFQKEAFCKQNQFLMQQGSCYNACEQGLGKTIQACATLNAFCAKKVLIVCPAVMRLTWQAEIKDWCTQPYTIATILDGKKLYDLRSNIVIISYNLVEKFLPQIQKFAPWDFLILDEAHMVKSIKAIRTKVILKEIWPLAKYHLALSGTPITNNVTDGFTLFHKMAPTIFPKFAQFAGEYSYQRATPWGIKYFGIRSAEKLSQLIRKYFFIRYTKEQVLPELPDKIYQKIWLPESYSVKAPSNEAEQTQEAAKAVIHSIETSAPTPVMPKCLQSLRREQGMKKLPAVLDAIKNMAEENTPVVVFYFHTAVGETILMELKDYNPQLIRGDTPPQARFNAVENFQAGKSNLFVGQIIASGVGITLTRASHCVFAELDWSPATVAQAADRLHRIGQKNAVNIYYFLVKNSIDERISEAVISKARDIAKVV